MIVKLNTKVRKKIVVRPVLSKDILKEYGNFLVFLKYNIFVYILCPI